MGRYRSKPVEVEALHFDNIDAVMPDWFEVEVNAGRAYYQGGVAPHYTLETANGPVSAALGDWIIREPSGVGSYPCKAAVFDAKYFEVPVLEQATDTSGKLEQSIDFAVGQEFTETARRTLYRALEMQERRVQATHGDKPMSFADLHLIQTTRADGSFTVTASETWSLA